VTSQLGFESLMWGKEVYCFGLPFFAGWGLTHDELPAPSRRASAGQRQLADLVHAALVEYAVYIDPHTLKPCEVEDLVCSIGLQRQRLAADPAQAGALGFTRWKRPFLRRFMPGCELSFLRSRVRQRHRQIVHWGRASEQLLLAHPGRVIQVEDGFLRSVGFGNKIHLRIVQLLNNVGIRAARPPSPLSWVVDNQGVYYDSTRPSALEGWLATADPSIEQLERAAALRQRLVQEAITKYNLSAPAWHRPSGLRRVVLVPGQVESDASIRFGAPGIRTNLELLKAVRNAEPDAYIIYKPHPDVVAGLRRSSVAESQALLVADLVLREASVQQLFAQVDAVHVLTSLAGFEALLRGIEVHVWGLPFYAGWGLTKDAHSCSRRGRKLSLDALVFGALIAYPRYVSRRSGWQITPEQAIDELVAWRASSTA
jgi:capsular polysaccharide export protein